MARFGSGWTANRDGQGGGGRYPGDPADKLEPVVLLGQQLCKKDTDPVVPVNQDVTLKEDNGLVDRSGPEETQSMNEPSALLH